MMMSPIFASRLASAGSFAKITGRFLRAHFVLDEERFYSFLVKNFVLWHEELVCALHASKSIFRSTLLLDLLYFGDFVGAFFFRILTGFRVVVFFAMVGTT